MMPLTLTSGLRTAAMRTPDKIALTDSERRLSYRQLINRVNRVVHLVRDMAIKPGNRAAILAPNCLEYIEIVAGLGDAGIAVATVNYRLNRREISQILNDCQARVLFIHPDCTTLLDREACPSLREVVVIDADYQATINRQASEPAQLARDELDTFSIPYTSGTTGTPKGVMLPHRARALTFFAMAVEYGCFNSTCHFLAIAPLCHGAGFAFAFAPLFFGGSVEIMQRFDAQQVLEVLKRRVHDGIFLVPTHFEAIFSLPQATLGRLRGHALTAIISNASALPQSLKEKIIAYFGDGLLHETYGSTEGGIVTNLRPDKQLAKINCVGLPFQGTEVELRNDAGEPVKAGEPGELFSRNLTGFSGYWQRPGETQDTLDAHGWITVGDVAVRDDEGYIYIIDRKKDMIISGGINIYPRQIEATIESIEWVKEAAVVGVSDAKWGEAIKAFVVRHPTAASHKEQEITDYCGNHLAGFKVPRTVEFIDTLPRNATGKLLRRELRKRS
ncbi:acyl--CoA ligase [Exilibacterium tricleocarpae]|uniref:Acyl--CoA ligase n=1 Tax=Exilibacterium tricleocarpae TaxID=2591008 RepID=A0A545U9P5_9GAMM|nr:class I adenylate-forming enzyme family protein [Exilibacterium tricleocarpae]TQV86194.1 acyl--CoA ligase [Exilibacterium tricleocarpae]